MQKTIVDLHGYQQVSVNYILSKPACALFLDMGLGKTVTTLTAVNFLLQNYKLVKRILVIAPKRICETVWDAEATEWSHTKHLRISKIVGDTKSRKAALMRPADIYCVSRDNIGWLVALYQSNWPFDMIVIDESSSFKNHDTERFRALRTVRPYAKRVVLLTGTPAPNGLLDLWAQYYLLDMGERLGLNITAYRNRYFIPNPGGFGYKIRPGAAQEIYDRVKDITISMKAEDYLTLPDLIEHKCIIDMPEKVMQEYKKFQRTLVLELIQENQITAVNAGVLSGKLTQFSNGAIYDRDGKYHELHNAKLEMLQELIEANQGKPLIIFYGFKHDADRISKLLAKMGIPVRSIENSRDVSDWNAGKIPVLLLHPASAGHGLNLQRGGNTVIWYGLTFNLELFQQAMKRLHRQGQKNTVIAHFLICRGTIDEKIFRAIETKADGQQALFDAVKYMAAA